MQSEKVKIAVFGHGHLGKWHCEKASLHTDSKLSVIVETCDEKLELLRQRYPGTKCIRPDELEQFWDEFDAGIIATPTSGHFELIQKLLRNKKHIFCEKPIVATPGELKDLEKMRKNHSDSKNHIQVGHIERYHKIWENELFKKVKGKMHFPFSLIFERLSPYKARAKDVDVVIDLMIHDIDLMLFLLGSLPTKVKAYGIKKRSHDFDVVHAHFTFEGGQQVLVCADRDYVKEVRLVKFEHELFAAHVDLMKFEARIKEKDKDDIRVIEYERRDHLLDEHGSFYDALKGKREVFVNEWDGLMALSLCHKVHKSLKEGREVLIRDRDC